ncbi:MAG TPA: metalloregulator ArsR/SmtB family transcription factor [Porticoccaceae bacterium]
MNTSATIAAVTDETGTHALASLLKAAGDPLRLEVLRVLRANAFGALELAEIFAMRQNAMSHHLKLLTRAGLVSYRREGTHIFYRRAVPDDALCREILAAVDGIPLSTPIRARIRSIEAARAATSREFFRVNADKFRAQQDLIAGYPQYGEAVVAALDRLTGNSERTVLEVGPGEGELLADLHPRFDRVVALDNAAEMLERSRQFAAAHGLEDIGFIHGDTSDAVAQGLSCSVITLNMVLHHTPSPASVIADLARVLEPGGVLLITELCRHDQDWAREACGDLWLGFEPDDLALWATEAGLSDGDAEYLPLKNGFRVQLRQFIRPSNDTMPVKQGNNA